MNNAHPMITDWAGNAEGLTHITDCIETLTGYTAEEVLARPETIIPSKDYDKLWTIQREHFSKQAAGRSNCSAVTVRMNHRDGYAVSVEVVLITLYEDGWPVEMVGMIRQCHCHRCPLVKQIVSSVLALGESDRRLVANLARRLAA